jgi:hypothetical protein
MAKRADHVSEVELRVELARRRDDRDQRQARSLCAVDSDHCRAGDEWEWFDLLDAELGSRGAKVTYCFCPAHSLAAEALHQESVRPAAPAVVAMIQELERRRAADKAAAG